MDVMRINSAHDEPGLAEAWSSTCIGPSAELDALSHSVDLHGPKLRTGARAGGPHPLEPPTGPPRAVVASARIWLRPRSLSLRRPLSPPYLPVEAHWLEEVRPGDDLLLADCRGMDRRLRVVAVDAPGVLTESRTAFVEDGQVLQLAFGDEIIRARARGRLCLR